MIPRVVLLLFLAPVLGGVLAAGSEVAPVGEATGALVPRRQLLQTTPTPADCAASVRNCVACRYMFYRGTVTKAVCLRCETGYVVKASGRSCWCAPGYFRDDSGLCQPCENNNYCTGAKSTQLSAMRTTCGTFKTTTTLYAKSERECVVLPGYAWAMGDGATPCPVGSYNPGYNTRKCVACPGSLTTMGEGSTAPQACQAPAGAFYLRGKAVACAKGTYKDKIGNVDCTPCPVGWTTPSDSATLTQPSDCSFVLPGYYAPPGMISNLGTTPAVPCPVDTYRPSDAPYTFAEDAAGLSCTPCPAALRTLAEGSTAAWQCLAPPGYGVSPSNRSASVCPQGTYNSGWNMEACTACGNGTITTDGPGATRQDDCKVPAGHGTTRLAGGTLSAAPCPAGTYGRDTDTYGLVDVECTKCLQYTTTASVGATAGSQCLTLGGYGWYNGAIVECDYAYYSGGNSQDPCTYCGEGYNTSTGPTSTVAASGATSADACLISAGWTADGYGGVKPCMQGYYKALLGNSSCVKCPAGTTTTLTFAPTQVSDCDACRPGFGADEVDLSAPACALCPSGTYSFGYVSGGLGCMPCTAPDGYAGVMVSRRGISNPDECYPEFMTDAAFSSLLRYNHIRMDPTVMTVTLNVTAADCEAACHAAAGCQYFVYTEAAGGGSSKCSLRDLGAAAADVSDNTKGHILFQISPSVYVAYAADPTDWASAGVDLASYPTREAAFADCDTIAACVGVKASGGAWKTFGGSLLPDTTAKVRVNGDAINPWLPTPSAS